MRKYDLKKERKDLYGPPADRVDVVDVPEMNCLMIDGEGDPNTSPVYTEAVEALFGLSYTLKFLIKRGEQDIDYAVMPLEGLWWADDMAEFSVEDKGNWKWTSLIVQPEFVTGDLVRAACKQVEKKKRLPALGRARFETFAEGLSAQILHIGPYAAERPTVERLHRFIGEQGYAFNGKHHEIYLSDLRRSAPEKLRTIIRQPIRPL